MTKPIIQTVAVDVAPEDQVSATAGLTVRDYGMSAPFFAPKTADSVPDEQDGADVGLTVPDPGMAAPVIASEAVDRVPDDQSIATAGPAAPDTGATAPTAKPAAADADPAERDIASAGPTASDLAATTAAVASKTVRAPANKRRSVASARPTAPVSLERKNRWKKRGGSVWKQRLAVIGGLLLVAGLATFLLRSGADATHAGPDTPLAKAVFEAFPEADPERIDSTYQDDLPLAATLHLPAHLIEPGQGVGNPFARLGAQFGGTERTLSGVEMASRLERIGNTVLPADMVRCHTYEIGGVSSAPESRRRTRALHLRLNPGC